MKVEIYNEENKLLATSYKFEGDSTKEKLDFGDFDISSLNNKVFTLKFYVDGNLYSFGFADENDEFGGARGAGIVDVL